MPAAAGPPLFAARLARAPEDFRVEERLELALDGRGEHLWLHVEKRLLNTADVVRLLERVYAVGSADVGVSGMKDRRAVTRQWFSVRTGGDAASLERVLGNGPRGAFEALGQTPPADVDAAALTVLDRARHGRKLRRGTHAANAFTVTLHDVEPLGEPAIEPLGEPAIEPLGELVPHGDAEPPGERFESALAARLDALRERGFPNYVGPQRFGRDGENVERARAWFRRPARRVSRLQRGLWLSAARGALFNRVCAARVADGSWCRLLPGEPAVLDATRSFFVSEGAADEATAARVVRGDVHPSGPWWGRGDSAARTVCRALEEAVLVGTEDLRAGLERAGLGQERRALRARPADLVVARPDARTLELAFTLPPGVFATTLLAELGDGRAAAPAP